MPFTGKATYTAGASLPEIAEDVSDLVSISSPYETPLLDALGDAPRAARSTVHEWLEDALVPDSDAITVVNSATSLRVGHADRFRAGDQIRFDGSSELALVTAVDSGTGDLTIVRNYGGTPSGAFTVGSMLRNLGNAALEGADASGVRVTARSRKSNFTQIFSVTVEVSGSELAVRQLSVSDELDYQKSQRTRELIRDLESTVINGVAPAAAPQGSSTVRRTMRGIIPSIQTHIFEPGTGSFPTD